MTTRVLVVDDQELLRTAFSSLIGAENDLEVVGLAADGRQAIELAAAGSPDVIVMDVRMLVMDGIEATRRITSDRGAGAPRVLILTTFDLDQYVFEALRAGASDGQRLVVGLAMDQLRPAGLAASTAGPGPRGQLLGGRGALGIPPMPTWAMITVIVGWVAGWSVIGAWRMATRDA